MLEVELAGQRGCAADALDTGSGQTATKPSPVAAERRGHLIWGSAEC